ncbi:MAG TPA: RNA polymerase subunit sigma-70, partial [Marinobacter hydrocarbonoclasticus]|nr:RNA polymerase subunit sigma-70 [Marinobacter nauticus]
MKESAKARRLKRHYRRNKSQGKMNLVSLMDIFTILVFFLMVNSSSDVQVLNQNNTIKLPDSTAQQPPGDVLALTVTDRDILVNGR